MEKNFAADLQNRSYKELSQELNLVIRALESNELELEDALKYYEKGVSLVRVLKLRLSEAEQRVETLMGELEPELDVEIDTKLS